jgi:hypothetical protein
MYVNPCGNLKYSLQQHGLASSFPQAKNNFPAGPKAQERPPDTIFEN